VISETSKANKADATRVTGSACVRAHVEQITEQSAQPSSGQRGSSEHFSAQSSPASSAIHAGAPLIAKTSASATSWRNRGTTDL